MREVRHRRIGGRRHQPVKEVLHIRLHLRVGVFLDQQAARGVLHEQRQNAVALPFDPCGHVAGKLIKTGAIGLEGETCVHNTMFEPVEP